MGSKQQNKEVIRRLGELDGLRQRVRNLEQAMQVLNPEERLVAERLFIHPAKGNVQILCQELEVEQSTVYRRRESVLKKLAEVMI